jgi:NaMN:DMB phosphoribosyltransferase
MAEQSGVFFCRCATILAGFVAMVAVISYFFNAPRGLPVVSVAALGIAGTVWLVGWAGRHLFLGR